MLNLLRFQYPAVLWTIFVLIMCDIPMGDAVTGGGFFEGFDKLVHTGFFFVLTTFLFVGEIRRRRAYYFRFSTVLIIVLLTAALGGLIELLQWQFFTYRAAEWWDLFCDMVGVGMGVFSFILLPKMRSYA